VHKIAFQIGSLTIHWYGVLVALGFLAGLWTASRRGLKEGFAPEKVFDAGVWLILGTVIGARALYVISYWDKLMEAPRFPSMPWTEIFMVQRGGLVFYGGLIGASLATVLYAYKNKLSLWRFADTLAPSIALGYVPGRIGCLMNGCCYGKATDVPWGIHFPSGHETPDVAVGGGVHVHRERGERIGGDVLEAVVVDVVVRLGVEAAASWRWSVAGECRRERAKAGEAGDGLLGRMFELDARRGARHAHPVR